MKIRVLSYIALTCIAIMFTSQSVFALKPLRGGAARISADTADKDAQPILTGTRLQGAPPKIDGIPDDAAWCGSYTSADFKLQDGAAPKGSTRVNVAYDEKNL